MIQYIRVADGRIAARDTSNGNCYFVYGPGTYTIRGFYQIIGTIKGQRLFAEQQKEMWDGVQKYMKICKGIATCFVDAKSLNFDELVNDVCVPALQRALVSYDHEHDSSCSMRTYIQRIVYRACEKAVREETFDEELTERIPTTKSAEYIGLSDRNELYELGLSASEIDLLLSRYDSHESLEQIANRLGFASRSTAANHLSRIISKCHARRYNSNEKTP